MPEKNEFRTAEVFAQNVLAGEISETDDGYKFTYDPQYLKSANPLAASLTLPLQEEAYESTTLFPFFDGLIPEGWLLMQFPETGKLIEMIDSDYCLPRVETVSVMSQYEKSISDR